MKTLSIAALGVLLLACRACAPRAAATAAIFDPRGGRRRGQDVFQTGVASWYGDDFHGKATADGEMYDMHKLTAAHQDLPFHTLVEVENLENGRKVLVRINDRGPFLKGADHRPFPEGGPAPGDRRKGHGRGQPARAAPGGDSPGAGGDPGLPGRRCMSVQAGAFAVRGRMPRTCS